MLRARRAAGHPLTQPGQEPKKQDAPGLLSEVSANSDRGPVRRRPIPRGATNSEEGTEADPTVAMTGNALPKRKFDAQKLGDGAGRLFDSGHKWLQLGKSIVRGEVDIGFQAGAVQMVGSGLYHVERVS